MHDAFPRPFCQRLRHAGAVGNQILSTRRRTVSEPHVRLSKIRHSRALQRTAGGVQIRPDKRLLVAASADHPTKDSHPPFIKSADTSDLVTIPIIKWGDPLPETGYCARMMPGRQAFDLYHNAVDIGRFPLPCYSVHEPSTTWRVMLTPPAVLADTVIVGGVVGVYASPYILQAYASH